MLTLGHNRRKLDLGKLTLIFIAQKSFYFNFSFTKIQDNLNLELDA